MATLDETSQPRMLAPTQIEAHVTRLTAVREGLRKFEADDGRAAEVVSILEVAINVLKADPFPTVPIEVPVEPMPEPETIEQVQARERAPGGAAAPNDAPDDRASNNPRKPSTGYGSDRGIV